MACKVARDFPKFGHVIIAWQILLSNSDVQVASLQHFIFVLLLATMSEVMELLYQTMEEIDAEIAHATRACPNCSVYLQRSSGCPYMKCATCNYAFCLLCGCAMETNRSTCTTHDCDEGTAMGRLVQLRLQKKRGIQNSSNAKECFAIQVEVKGSVVTVFLPKTANVGELKQAVHVKTAIAPAQQALQFMGKMLTADYQSIVAAGLRNKSTVTMTVITQGGRHIKP
jgi:hypothetical protein